MKQKLVLLHYVVPHLFTLLFLTSETQNMKNCKKEKKKNRRKKGAHAVILSICKRDVGSGSMFWGTCTMFTGTLDKIKHIEK